MITAHVQPVTLVLKTMDHADVVNVFWNWDYNKDPWWETDMYTYEMLEGGYLDVLQGFGFVDAHLKQSVIINKPFNPLTIKEWPDTVEKLIADNHLPDPPPPTIFNIFLPTQEKNLDSECLGGKSSFHTVIVTNGAEMGWIQSMLSHETAEAITDPVFKKGWSAANGTEIGDICGTSTSYGSGVVSLLYINRTCTSGSFNIVVQESH